jgi:hypothetical protein
MIKKVSHIIVSVLLLEATIGFTIYRNHCGEELMAKSLQKNEDVMM